MPMAEEEQAPPAPCSSPRRHAPEQAEATPTVPSLLPPVVPPAHEARLREEAASVAAPTGRCGVRSCLLCSVFDRPTDPALVAEVVDVVNEVGLMARNAWAGESSVAPAAAAAAAAAAPASPSDPNDRGEAEEEEEEEEVVVRVEPRGPSPAETTEAAARIMALLSLGSPTCLQWTVLSLVAKHPEAVGHTVAAGCCRFSSPGRDPTRAALYQAYVEDMVGDLDTLSATPGDAGVVFAMACDDAREMYHHDHTGAGALAYRLCSLSWPERGSDGTPEAPWPVVASALRRSGDHAEEGRSAARRLRALCRLSEAERSALEGGGGAEAAFTG